MGALLFLAEVWATHAHRKVSCRYREEALLLFPTEFGWATHAHHKVGWRYSDRDLLKGGRRKDEEEIRDLDTI